MSPLVTMLNDAAPYWVPRFWSYLYENSSTINDLSRNFGLTLCSVLGNVGFACST
ncbi:hypothetical protein SKPI104516_09305 [Skermania piniformis]